MSDEATEPPGESGESDCRKAALKYLSRREYATVELCRKLRHKGFAAELCEAVITHLTEQDLISNRRYAEAVLRSKIRKGRGPARIRLQLESSGVPKHIIDEVLVTPEVDWQEQARLQVQKKYGEQQPESYKDWVKRARFLNNLGYSSDLIKNVIEFSG